MFDPSWNSVMHQINNAERAKALSDAAPELLVSLKEMVAELLAHASLGLNEKEIDMLKRAEAAIAKAEG